MKRQPGNLRLISVKFLCFTALLSLYFVSTCVWASVFHPHDDIRNQVKQFVLSEISEDLELSPVKLDRRLKLKQCDQKLQIFWPQGIRKSGSVSVGVSCNGNKPWKIYVQTTVRNYRFVAVANRYIRRGEMLKQADFKMERRDVSRLNGRFHEDINSLSGQKLTQSLATGALLRPGMLQQSKVVRRGQKVTLLAGSNGVEIRVKGQALSDGTKGDWVRVRNLSSKRVVEGEVVSDGVVKVN